MLVNKPKGLLFEKEESKRDKKKVKKKALASAEISSIIFLHLRSSPSEFLLVAFFLQSLSPLNMLNSALESRYLTTHMADLLS